MSEESPATGCAAAHYWLNWCEECGWVREEEHVYYPEGNPAERLHVKSEVVEKSAARGLERLRVVLFWRDGTSIPKNPLAEKENA